MEKKTPCRNEVQRQGKYALLIAAQNTAHAICAVHTAVNHTAHRITGGSTDIASAAAKAKGSKEIADNHKNKYHNNSNKNNILLCR